MKKKIALITGAGKGIGQAIAYAFVQKDIFPIIIDIDKDAARNTTSHIREMGYEAAYYVKDVSKVNDIEELVSEVIRSYERIDILINNAGILSTTMLEDLDETEWDRVLSINLKSAAFLMKQVVPVMKMNNWGRIINISSLAGRMGGISTGCAYSASKAGLLGLSMCIARKVAQYGITVNSIAPGTTETELTRKFTENEMKNLIGSIPVGKLIQPSGIADAVCFLVSESAEFVTGAILDINGGMFMSS
jgi:3-oxoacyl-[acyl-carrier protein] reductase